VIRKGDQVADKRSETQGSQEWRTLSREELDNLAGEPLPERVASSLIDANIGIPVTAAVTANLLDAELYETPRPNSEVSN
jgi:hypothetical protein